MKNLTTPQTHRYTLLCEILVSEKKHKQPETCIMINDDLYHNVVLLHYTLWYIINHNACFRLFLFSDINISQGNVATHSSCGGIFYWRCARKLLSLTVKELRESVII